MNLEFDPDFVASKVDLLESDISDIEDTFVRKSQMVYDVESRIERKSSKLSLLIDRINSLMTLERINLTGQSEGRKF